MLKRSRSPSPTRLQVPSQQVPPERPPGIHGALLPLANYLASRALVGRPLLDNLNPLIAAEMSVQETRQILPVGRGNVLEDTVDSNYRNVHLTSLGRNISNLVVSNNVLTDVQRGTVCAAAAAATGAGNCGEHAAIAARVHASRLGVGQEVRNVTSLQQNVDHVWAVQTPTANNAGPTIVMDAWARGTAVLLEDAQPLYSAPSRTTEAFTAASGQVLRADCQTVTEGITNNFGRVIERTSASAHPVPLDPSLTYREYGVTRPEFLQDAQAAAVRATQATPQNPDGSPAGPAPQATVPGNEIPRVPALNVLIPMVWAARVLGANVKTAANYAKTAIVELAARIAP
jgi:hypothetical protein